MNNDVPDWLCPVMFASANHVTIEEWQSVDVGSRCAWVLWHKLLSAKKLPASKFPFDKFKTVLDDEDNEIQIDKVVVKAIKHGLSGIFKELQDENLADVAHEIIAINQ